MAKTLLQADGLGVHYGAALALDHVGLAGNRDEALQFLNTGLNEKTNWMVWTAVDPRWQSMRGDTRFKQLLKNIGP